MPGWRVLPMPYPIVMRRYGTQPPSPHLSPPHLTHPSSQPSRHRHPTHRTSPLAPNRSPSSSSVSQTRHPAGTSPRRPSEPRTRYRPDPVRILLATYPTPPHPPTSHPPQSRTPQPRRYAPWPTPPSIRLHASPSYLPFSAPSGVM